jgi:hypothetical protein
MLGKILFVVPFRHPEQSEGSRRRVRRKSAWTLRLQTALRTTYESEKPLFLFLIFAADSYESAFVVVEQIAVVYVES